MIKRIELEASDYECGLTVEQYVKEEKKVDIFYRVADPYTQRLIHSVYRLGFTDGIETCLEEANQQADTIHETAFGAGYDAGYKDGYHEGEF